MISLRLTLFVLLVFIVGVLVGSFFNFYSSVGGLTGLSVAELPSRSRISSDDISVFSDRLVLNIDGASIRSYDSSGSMVPVLNEESQGIVVQVSRAEDINVGDVISFRLNNRVIVHRVVSISEDEQGIFYLTKGDNNDFVDGKIRFSEVEWVLVGVLY